MASAHAHRIFYNNISVAWSQTNGLSELLGYVILWAWKQL